MATLNLRHVAISLALGFAAKYVADLNPAWFVDAQGKRKVSWLTPASTGGLVAAGCMYMLYTGRAEGMPGADGGAGEGFYSFYANETMPGLDGAL
jgi:hypothetical protein